MFAWLALIAAIDVFKEATGYVYVSPETGAFVLQRKNRHSSEQNVTKTEVFLQNGCARPMEQALTTKVAGKSYSIPLYPSAHNLFCSVAVKVAKEETDIDRPYADVVVFRDHTWPSMLKQKLCVTVQFTNSAGASVAGSCTFSDRENSRHACLIRQEIPLSWFPVSQGAATAVVGVSYAAGHYCTAPQISLPNSRIVLTSRVNVLKGTTLKANDYGILSLFHRHNLSFTADSTGTFLVHYKHLRPENRSVPRLPTMHLWLEMERRLEIISISPLAPKPWTLKIKSSMEPVYRTLLTLVPTNASDTSWQEDYLLALVVKFAAKTSAVPAPPEVRDKDDLQMIWTSTVMFPDKTENNESVRDSRIVATYPTVRDAPFVVVSIAKVKDLINTAVLTGSQTSTLMRVFTITEGGELFDVTDESHCISAEPRILKTSPTCTSVYVDGSELRGLANLVVHIQYKAMAARAYFTVWYPKLPITVWIADPILNAIQEWHVPSWKNLPKRTRMRRDARQFVCRNRYQQSEVRVLAAFHVVDEATGERTYLTGDPELMFDLTKIAMNRVHSSDHEIVAVRKKNGRLIATAKRTGTARIVVKALAPAIDYGSSPIMVTDDRVSAAQLNVRPVTDVQLHLFAKPSKPHLSELVSRIQSSFTHQYQHGSLEIAILYSDGQRELLSDVEENDYALSIFSTDQETLRVRHPLASPNVELVALSDRSDVTLTVELRSPAFCEEMDMPPLTSGQTGVQIFFAYDDKHRHIPETTTPSLNATASAISESPLQVQSILGLTLIVLLVIGLFHVINCHRRGIHNGYENSMSSGSIHCALQDEEEVNKEWVWFPKVQPDENSFGSQYSQRSTIDVSERSASNSRSSPEDTVDRRRRSVSVSYRGSEISVFIAPNQSTVAVNQDFPRELDHGHRSWRSTNGKSHRIQRTSKYWLGEGAASEHENLHRYVSTSTVNPSIVRRTSDNAYWDRRDDQRSSRRLHDDTNRQPRVVYGSHTLHESRHMNGFVDDDPGRYQSMGRRKHRSREHIPSDDWRPPKFPTMHTRRQQHHLTVTPSEVMCNLRETSA